MTANEIRRWRERQGVTQSGAARLLGVSLRGYQHYESGERRVSETVARLARAIELLQARHVSLERLNDDA
jgi:transcriptional regulator with XRE-family HTH domain